MIFRKLLLLVILFLLMLPAGVPTGAQGSTVLTIAVPDYLTDTFNDTMFADFEAEHPGVDVVVVKQGEAYIAPVEFGIESHLEQWGAYASLADVVYVSGFEVSPEATQAGYLLDLAPLAMTDPELNAADFYPALWESFQWDNGMWALPVSAAVTIIVYDPAAFDAAGLRHPDGTWTLDDYANAIRTLRKDDQYAILPYSLPTLFRSMLAQGLVDDSMVPNLPKVDSPEMAAILDTWVGLEREGLLQTPDEADTARRTAYKGYPIEITPSVGLIYGRPDQVPVKGALLPGDSAGLIISGFGVSAGTTQPELAYELTKYMTTRTDVAFRMFADVAARRELNSGSIDGVVPLHTAPQEVRDLIFRAAENAIPLADMRYTDYLSPALRLMRTENLDGMAALQRAQQIALDNAQIATSNTAMVSVETVHIEPLPEGEIGLTFALYTGLNVAPNEHLWTQTLEDFAASDPQVGRVTLDVRPMPSDFGSADCFFTPFPMSMTLNLEPLAEADPTFNRDDLLIPFDGYGLPMVIYPDALIYDRDVLEQHGLNVPQTISDFDTAMKTLEAPAYLPPQRFGGAYLLGLMAAYGALPIDYRTTPPTVNLNQAAVQQVLDLAKSGAIAYSQIYRGVGGGSAAEAPLMGDMFSPVGRYFMMNNGGRYAVTTLPQGGPYTPVAYTAGAAYINMNAQNPEACYRLISTLAGQPELFGGMPARRSQLDDPRFTATQSADALAFYQDFVAMMEQPNAVMIPDVSQLGLHWQGNYFVQGWIDQAFDRYVINGEDFAAVMDEAQRKVDDFLACTAAIPVDEIVFEPFRECAVKVDPTLQM